MIKTFVQFQRAAVYIFPRLGLGSRLVKEACWKNARKEENTDDAQDNSRTVTGDVESIALSQEED